jgi:hypothetical protein
VWQPFEKRTNHEFDQQLGGSLMRHFLFSALRRLVGTACIVVAAMAGTSGEAHALSCPTGQVLDGALCYSPPRAGYSCTGSLCMQNCPAGYTPSVPGFCHYGGATTYTVAPYLTRTSTHPHKCGLLFYANCRSNYAMNVCGICSFRGSWDTARHSYWRAAGVSADFTQAFNRVSSTMQATYGSSIGAIQAAYATAMAQIQHLLDAVLLQIFRNAAKIQLAQGGLGTTMTSITTAFQNNLSGDDLNAIKRLLATAAANKTLSAADVLDIDTVMGGIAQKLGLAAALQAAPSADRPERSASVATAALSTKLNCSWGITTGVSGGFVAGATESFSIMRNCNKEADGRYKYVVITTTGGTLGAAAIGGGEIGFVWDPTPVDTQAGPFVGLVGEAAYGLGGAASLTWSVAKGMRGAQNAIPGVTGRLVVGGGVQAALIAGNSWVLQTFVSNLP